jgi:hypothetical protein
MADPDADVHWEEDPAADLLWEQEVMRQLEGHQADRQAVATSDLPSHNEALRGESRYPQRSRSQPDRYGDWSGSTVNWVKEVIHTISDSAEAHTVSDSVQSQMVHDAVRAYDLKATVDLETCEWSSLHDASPQVFAATLAESDGTEQVPMNIREARASPSADKWKAATDSEFESLLKNNTWELVKREEGMKVLPCKSGSLWSRKMQMETQ